MAIIPERIIKKAMTTFMEASNLLNRERHCFKKGLPYTTSLLIAGELGNKKSEDNVYIYFSRASDKMPKNRLLLKLKI